MASRVAESPNSMGHYTENPSGLIEHEQLNLKSAVKLVHQLLSLNIIYNTIYQITLISLAVCVSTFANLAQASHIETALTEFSAYYNVVKGGITVGETRRSVKATSENTFEFRSETVPRGIFRWISDAYVLEQSIWQIADENFRPLEYRYKNINDDKVRDVKLLFDWEKKRVTNIINGDPWHMALAPGVQDKLLFQLKMMQDLIDGSTSLKYSVADGGKIKQYSIENLGNEFLEIELGRFKVVKLERVTDTKRTIWWCAEQLHYLPIKILQQKHDGGRVVAILYKLEGIDIPRQAHSPAQTNIDLIGE
jgi:hypothetical protein